MSAAAVGKAGVVDAEYRPIKPFGLIKPFLENQGPKGLKFWLLDLGNLYGDVSFNVRGVNHWTTKHGDKPIQHECRKFKMVSVLIEHPDEGLILYECGSGKGDGSDEDYLNYWGPMADVFCRVDPDTAQELPEAIRQTGHDIKDVKHIILGHMHFDHAGGLVFFKDRKDVKLWVHEKELKHAFWGIAAKTDSSYLPYYLSLDANWQPIYEDHCDLFSGISLHLCPGHSPGLMVMQLNMPKDGTFIFTTDHMASRENYEDGIPQGSLMKDNEAWHTSTAFIKRLHRATGGRIFYGHDYQAFDHIHLKRAPSGHDDAFALFLALNRPEIDVLGVSACHGNSSVDYCAANAARCLEGFHAPAHIAVYKGASQGILRPFTGGAHRVHGQDGLDGVQGLDPPDAPNVLARISKQTALEGLQSACLKLIQTKQKMTVCVTGPFSNVAIFLLAFPHLAKDAISEFLVMGGALDEPGNANRSKSAEWNVYADPDAAKILFQSHSIPVRLFPLDVTHQAIFRTNQEYLKLTSKQSNTRLILSTIAKFFSEAYASVFTTFPSGPPVHDLLTVAYFIDPTLFEGYNSSLDVEMQDPHRGKLLKTEAGPVQIWIASKVDTTRLWDLFFAALDLTESAGGPDP